MTQGEWWSFFIEYSNGIATVFALGISSLSLLVQHMRDKRQIGRLEVSSISDTCYYTIVTTNEGGGYTRFKLQIDGRNVADGVLQIYSIQMCIDGTVEEFLLAPDENSIRVAARDSFSEDFKVDLDENLGDDGDLEGVILFNTSYSSLISNGNEQEVVTFSKSEDANNVYEVR